MSKLRAFLDYVIFLDFSYWEEGTRDKFLIWSFPMVVMMRFLCFPILWYLFCRKYKDEKNTLAKIDNEGG